MCNEIGRLGQDFDTIQGNKTIFFIHKHQVPKNKKATCGTIVYEAHPLEK